MNRILHIFRKDAIRLWPQVLVFLAMLAANVSIERWYPHDAPNKQTLLAFLMVLLPVACCVLLIALIHEERLVGDRQYWLSRPIPRRELIAAKILFTPAFVNLPVLLYQAVMVRTGGLPLLRNWSNLLWLQLFFTAIDVLPIIALASVTKNMGQAVLAALATTAAAIGLVSWLTFYASYISVVWPLTNIGLVWIAVTLAAAALAAGSVVVLMRQYKRRGTMLSRALLLGTVALAVCSSQLPHSAKWAIQMKVSPENVSPNAFRVSAARYRPLYVPDRQTPDGGPVSLELPVDIDATGGMIVNAEAPFTNVVAPSGESWRLIETGGGIRGDHGLYFMTMGIDRAFYNRVKDIPVHFYGVFDLTILANRQTMPLPGRSVVAVPGIGVCAEQRERPEQIACNSMLPRARIQLIDGGLPGDGSATVLAPYPYSFAYSPITGIGLSIPEQFRGRPDQVAILIQQPVAYIQRSFDFGNIILADYEVGHP